jgi:uncharacterized protein
MKSKDIFSIIETHDLVKFEQWIAEGFNVNQTAPNPSFWTPLQDAVDELDYVDELDDNISTKIVERLLQAGANPNFWDRRSINSPLMMAIMGGHHNVAKLLLEYGADIKVRTSEGMNPLLWSAHKDDLKMVNLLVKHGLSDMINDSGGMAGMNALGIAISSLNLPMVKTLIKAGADPSFKDANLRVAEDIIPSDADHKVQLQLRNFLKKK